MRTNFTYGITDTEWHTLHIESKTYNFKQCAAIEWVQCETFPIYLARIEALELLINVSDVDDDDATHKEYITRIESEASTVIVNMVLEVDHLIHYDCAGKVYQNIFVTNLF